MTGVSPDSGPLAGDIQVTVTGTGFASNATRVDFGANPATDVVVSDATSLTALSPPGGGIVDVTVTTVDGTSVTSSADQFSYTGGPDCHQHQTQRGACWWRHSSDHQVQALPWRHHRRLRCENPTTDVIVGERERA